MFDFNRCERNFLKDKIPNGTKRIEIKTNEMKNSLLIPFEDLMVLLF